MLIAYFFIMLSAGFASATENADTVFLKFVQHPGTDKLDPVERACVNKVISPDLLDSNARLLARQPNTAGVRAMITIRLSCSDGALAEDLQGLLGVNILMSSPRVLIQALAREAAPGPFTADLAKATGTSGASPFLDCDATCLPRIKEFYEKKRKLIKAISVSARDETVARMSLIQGIDEAETEWRIRLRKSQPKPP